MSAFYYATKQLQAHVYDVCLLQITAEATEIGIVRDGSLTHCAHIAFGRNAIVREVEALTKQPVSDITQRLSDILATTEEAGQDILLAYQKRITELLKQTGDSLSIPRTMYLAASDSDTKALQNSIQQATEAASKTTSTILSVSEFDTMHKTPHLMSIPTRFFHTSDDRMHFHFV